MSGHTLYRVLGSINAGATIYAALTGNPGLAAIAGGLAFFYIYPQNPS